MDIQTGDRVFKERERQSEAVGPLSKLISEIKLREFECANMIGSGDDAHASPAAEKLGTQDVGRAKKHENSGERDDAQDCNDGAVTLGGGFVSGGMIPPLSCTSRTRVLATVTSVCAYVCMCVCACVCSCAYRRGCASSQTTHRR